MNRTAWNRLKAGEMIENTISEKRYVLTERVMRTGWIGVRTVVATDPDQWRKVTEAERAKK
jgi:hypothetical protein